MCAAVVNCAHNTLVIYFLIIISFNIVIDLFVSTRCSQEGMIEGLGKCKKKKMISI